MDSIRNMDEIIYMKIYYLMQKLESLSLDLQLNKSKAKQINQ